MSLHYVHRRALNYLVTLSSNETNNTKAKLERGELLGIDEIVLADTNEFDALIDKLKEIELVSPGKVDIVTAEKVIKQLH